MSVLILCSISLQYKIDSQIFLASFIELAIVIVFLILVLANSFKSHFAHFANNHFFIAHSFFRMTTVLFFHLH